MPTIKIDTFTKDLIRSLAQGDEYRDTSTRLGDNEWLVYVDDDVYDRLWECRLPAESFSDTIQRLANKGRAN